MSSAIPVVIYGAGGHGKVVLDALERAGRRVAGFLDDDPQRVGGVFCGHPVFGELGRVEDSESVEVVVAIGDALDRHKLTVGLEGRGYALATVVHPSAVVAPDVVVGPGTMVLAGAIINPGARVGQSVIINTGALVDHDCVIGDYAHIAPGVRLAGNVSVGERALVGLGATVVPGTQIGAGAMVGAGAVVISDVADGQTVTGVPAKPTRAPAARGDQ